MGLMGHCWRLCDKMKEEMENMVCGMMPAMGTGGVGDMLMPAVRVDVGEDEDEVFVVADLPGVEREQITACLISPTQLGIWGERRSEKPDTGEGGQIMRQERAFGRMKRVVLLPHEATAEGAKASLTNGVLEIRLKKCTVERGERIPIE